MTGKVKCTCGWSWDKSDSSKKDMYICHECGRDNSNNMKNGGWLDSYEDGGTMQEHQENYNNSETSVPEGYEGEGYSMKGRNYSPAWGGQFQMGGFVYPVNYVPQAQNGKLTFLQPTSEKLPEGYRIPYSDPSTERAGTIGGENGEPAYLVPSFKYGHPIYDPVDEFRKTGEHLGGPFKTWQEADKWESETRHPAVEKGENIMFPQEQFAMGGSIPGAVGFSYARTQGAAPSKGPHRNKVDVTDASAQNGKEMQYYQNGLDFKPKSISKNGAWLDNYEQAQDGVTKFNANKFIQDRKADTPLQRSINKESNSEDYRKWVDTKEYKDQVKANKIAQDKATLADRKSRISKSVDAQKKSFTKDNWRQQLADETQATGDKFRMFPEDPDSFVDEWLNPGVMIGNMASDLGSAPLRAQQEDSYMPYATSIGVPLLTGGLEGLGAKTTKQFVSNLINPLNVVPGYHSAEKAIGKKLGNISTSIAPELRQGLRTAGPSFDDLPKELQPYLSRTGDSQIGEYTPYQEDDYIKWFNQQKAKINPPIVKQDPRSMLRGSSIIDINDMKYGGVIKDDRGQWDHPGEITEIGSNNITMEGVPYDVLGISDTGDTKLMKPGKNYKFKGKKVTEYPMAKDGLRQEQKGLQNLDNLTNFTNYNKPQPGGWLNKYN